MVTAVVGSFICFLGVHIQEVKSDRLYVSHSAYKSNSAGSKWFLGVIMFWEREFDVIQSMSGEMLKI